MFQRIRFSSILNGYTLTVEAVPYSRESSGFEDKLLDFKSLLYHILVMHCWADPFPLCMSSSVNQD